MLRSERRAAETETALRPRRAAALAAACLSLAALAELRAQTTAPDPEREPDRPVRIRQVQIDTRNVYSEQEADHNVLFSLVNLLHYPTDPEVLRREMWFGPGDIISAEDIAELERNLRAMGLFGDVSADLQDVEVDGDDRSADLRVDSRDSFSLIFNGSVSLAGGVFAYNAAVGENNLLGTGKRVSVSGHKDDLQSAGQVRYVDPQFLDTWHRLTVSGGATSEGPLASIDVVRPFKHLTDPTSYGAGTSFLERNVDYFQLGQTVAQVPQRRIGASLFYAHGFGPRDLRSSVGPDILFRQLDYSPATGPGAGLIRVPGDTTELQLGGAFTLDWVHSYRKETRIDTIDYVEDIELGANGRVRLAALLRDEAGNGTALEPLIEASLRSAIAPLPDTYVTLQLAGSLRLRQGETVGWRAATAVHAYQKSLPFQTLAASFTFDAAEEDENLPIQFTLGEDNGLRGYPAREFSGSRFARLNLEDRIFTDLELLSVNLGLVAFLDVGWVHNAVTGQSMSDPVRGAGVGLRAGSTELFGGQVFRVDVGWPLDSFAGQDYSVSVSFGTGQVFGFFGNQNVLGAEF